MLGPSTCVIRGNPQSSERKSKCSKVCPLCSDEILKQRVLLQELESIEQRYLGRVEPAAITRIQYAHYMASYRRPLENHDRSFVDITKGDIAVHFEEHRVSHARMLLHDVQAARRVQREMIQQLDGDCVSENRLKTWMQLSKHKHDLVRMLSQTSDAVTHVEDTRSKLHLV